MLTDIRVGDEVYNRFDESAKPYIVLKIEDETARPNRLWVLTLDRTNGEILYDNTVWLEKSGRQWDVSIDILDYLEKILSDEKPVYKLPKKIMTSQTIQVL